MFSYIALTWDVREAGSEQNLIAASMEQQLRLLQDFRIVMSVPGICIVQKAGLQSACGACLLADDGGAILGTLFSWPAGNETPQRQLAVVPADAAKIIASQGSHLLTHYWGRYVAFVRSPQSGRYAVIRDPSGMLPCFRTSHRGMQIWFSRLEDLSTLGLPEPAIDWRYIETHVVARAVQSYETGLLGIQEVKAGERWEVERNEVIRKVAWDAASISSTDVIEDAGAAAERLRAVTKGCVDAWASAYSGILHTLSGGLDSSIVAVLLGHVPTRTPVTCVNYHTTEAEGDERYYARLAAGKAGFELIEKCRVARSVDLRRVLDITPTPSPWVYWYHVEHADYEIELAHAHRAAAIFTGGGGDGVFYQSGARFAVADYVQRHGLTSRLAGIALDAARLEGKSLMAVLVDAFTDRRQKARRRLSVGYLETQTLVSPAIIASQAVMLQARFDSSARLDTPVGKWWHIQATSVPPGFYDQFGSPLALERVTPLLSQPIVELCLKIPTYVLMENGWDRAIARRAFESDLPPAVVNRRGKGGIEAHIRATFNANIPFLREFLLDGELAQRGILNRQHLEYCLSGGKAVTGPEFTEIQEHLSTQAWIRCLGGNRTTRVAA